MKSRKLKIIILIIGCVLTIGAGVANSGSMIGAWNVEFSNFALSVAAYLYWAVYLVFYLKHSESPKDSCGWLTGVCLAAFGLALIGNNPITLVLLCPFIGITAFLGVNDFLGIIILLAVQVALWWAAAVVRKE